MRKFERWLSVLMCICLLCTSMPGQMQLVYAEEALAAAAESIAEVEGAETPEIEAEVPAEAVMLAEEEEPAPASAEMEEAEETAEPEVTPEAEAKTEPEEPAGETSAAESEEEQSGEVSVTPPQKPDSIQPVVESTETPEASVFDFGYAKITGDEPLYEAYRDRSDEIAEVKRGGIVLVTERRTEEDGSLDRVKVIFVHENETVEGWLDAESAEPLTDEEIESFVEEINEHAADDEEFELIFYQRNEEMPLPCPEVEMTAEEVVMTLGQENAELKAGDSVVLQPAFSDGVARAVSYSAEADGIVAIDEDGAVTALSVGETTVTVSCEELNAAASVLVKVTAAAELSSAPVGMTVTPAALEMIVGESEKITCTLSEGAEGAVEYALSTENVISIDADGTVTALGEGSCVITAALVKDGVQLASAQAAVNVYALPDSLEISAAADLDVGGTAVLTVNVPDGLKSRIEYASSDEAVAEIDENGNVTAIAPGVSTLTATLGDLKAEHVLTVYGAPEDFEFTVSNSVLNVGDTAQLNVVLPEFTRGEVIFDALNPLAVGVDAEGLVMAIGHGKCELTATVGGVTKSLFVEVYGAPTELPLVLGADTLMVGYHTQVSVELSEYAVAEITFRSSNPDVADVDENGVVTAKAVGTCEIIAESDNGLSESCALTVVECVLDLGTKYINLAVGESFTLDYTISEDVFASEAPVFVSSNEQAVKVDPVTGALKAVGEGSAVISVSLGETGVSADCYVNVFKSPTSVKIVKALTTVGKGQITDPIEYDLFAGSESTVGAVTFSSSNQSVLQVNTRGQMKGIKAGTATVTVTSYNGEASVSFKVTVLNAPTSLKISPASATLAVGQTGTISYTLNSKTAAGMTFSTSNESVAVVDANGRVTAVGVGQATITVSTHNGLKKTCAITVTKAPENVTFKQTDFRLGVDMTAAVTPVVDTTSSVDFTYEYWTDAPGIISVDETTGTIKALAPGMAKVFVRTYNGVASHEEAGERVATSAVVNVVPKPDHVTIDGTEFNVIVGKIIKLPVKMTMNNGSEDCLTTYTLSTSSSKYVAVNSAGQVKGVKAGTATITLKAGNGDVVTCKVVVRAAPKKVVLDKSSIVIGENMKSSLAVRVYYSSSKYFLYSPEDSLGTGTFSSSNPAAATVDPATGEIFAVAKGETVITFTTLNGKKASCKVTVKGTPTVIDMDRDEIKLGVDMEETLKAVFLPDEMGNVTFRSSDESIAKVDETSGKVKAVAPGEATITIDAGNDVTNTCKVNVVPKPDHVTIDGTEFNVIVGKIIKLPVKMTMNNGSEDCLTTYTLSTSSSKYVAVNSAGQVKGVKAGTATITLKAGNGDVVTCKVVVRAAPKKVVLDKSSIVIGENMKSSLAVRVYYSSSKYFLYSPEDSLGTGTFSSSNPAAATVDPATGEIFAVAKGETVITFTTLNGKKASCKVTVKGTPTVIDMDRDEIKLGVDMEETLKAVFLPDEMGNVTFRSSDESIAKVDETSGKVKAVAPGEATITIDAGNDVTNTCKVNVVPKPDHVTIDGTEFNVIVGKIIKLPVKMTMNDGSEDCLTTYTLSTSSSKYVAVNSAGQVKGVKAGTATITLKAGNGDVVTCKVVVRAAPKKVVLDKSSIVIGENMKSSLAVRVYYSSSKYFLYSPEDSLGTGTFSSSNPAAATVDPATGEIFAVAKGETAITFTTLNGKKASCKVTVKGTPTVIDMDRDEIKLGVDMEETLKAVFLPDEMGNVTFRSSDESIATVDATSGKVKAVAPGEATITIDAGNDVTNTCKVNVVPKPDHVTIDGTEFNVIVGKIIKLPVKMTMNNGSEDCLTTYTLSTSSSKYAAVNSAGQVKGVKAGTATITLKAGNGDVVTCKVVVRAAPKKVVLDKSSIVIGENMKSSLAVRVYYSSSKYFLYSPEDSLGTGTFSSSNPAAATVDPATGEIFAVAKGETVITFTTLNGKKASCKVTVKGTPTVIDMDRDEIRLGVDMEETLKAVFLPDEMGNVTFRSSDESIAAVDAVSGKVKAVAPGEATITIDAGNDVTNTCKVNVVPKPDHVTIDGTEFNVIVGKIIKLPVKMTMNNGSEDCLTTYTLSTSSSKYVAVNSAGQVKGVKAGTATITLKAGNGDVVTCKVVVRAAPKKVVLDKSSLTLGVGMDSSLAVRVYYSSSSYFTYSSEDSLGTGTFRSTDPSVVEVDAVTGKMKAVSTGTATVGFETLNGKYATCRVTVVDAPTSIALSKKEIEVGEKLTSSLSVIFNEGELGWIKYSSSDESIATVDANGKITGVSAGPATITALTLNDVKAECKVKVVPAPDKITLNMDSSNLAISGKITLQATCTYQGTDECIAALTWKSSNSKVATVTSDGVVKGIKAGSAIIRVTAQNGEYADCNVVVRKKPTKVQFGVSSVSVGVGQRINVPAKVFFSGGSCMFSINDSSYARITVDDTSVAAVDPKTGDIIGVDVGRTSIRLTTYNGLKAACSIVVAPGPEWIALNHAILTMSEGETQPLYCELSPGSISQMTYTSSNPGAVTVVGAADGCRLTAVGQGSATITATSANGKTSTCEVTVMARPDKIEFAQNSISIGLEDTARLPKVTVSSESGECSQVVAYAIEGTAVTMTTPGYVTGVKPGTAVVKAYIGDVSAECTVTVLPKPTSITVTPERTEIGVGDTTQLTVWMDAAGGYTFSVEDESIAFVSEDGEVTALSPGKTKITVESYNGCTNTCEITVLPLAHWVKLDADSVKIAEGKTFTLNASIPENTLGEMIFSSSDEKIAVVDASGNVTAMQAGKATVYVHIDGHDEVFDTCEVTVLAKPETVLLSLAEMKLRSGTSAMLTAEFIRNDAAECYGTAVYESSDIAVATVDSDGKITAHAAGEAVIAVSLDSDRTVTASCKVTVFESSVGFESGSIVMSVGETRALNVALPEGEDHFSLMNSGGTVVKVNASSRTVTALAEGTATITAVNGSDTASCVITVTAKPEAIVMPAEQKLVIGKSFALNAELLPAGTAAQLTYTSSNEKAVKVSADGVVEAVGYGAAVVRAANYDASVTAECVVRAVYAPDTIRFGELSDIVIAAGDSYVLETPAMYNEDGECDAEYTLAVSNTNVARVSAENGGYVVHALAQGVAALRLKTENGKTATHTLVVVDTPDSISFADDAIRMAAGERFVPAVFGDNGAVVAADLTSSDNQVVAVGEDGALVAVKEGEATVMAVASEFPELSAVVRVEVVKAPESMTINAGSGKLALGESIALKAEFADGTASAAVTYVSGDENILRTGSNGSVLAVGEGEATITAIAFGGVTASCTLKVMKAPTALEVSPAQITACVKDQVQLAASFGSEAEFANVTYETDDASIANVSPSGLVTFAGVGETVIRVLTFNGLETEVPVTVCETPGRVSFELTDAVILKGDSAKLNIVFDQGAGYYTLTSSKPEMVSVTNDGTVTALKTGSSVITLEMPALRLKAVCTVRVVDALEGILLTAEKTTLELHEELQPTYTLMPENAVGTGLVTFASSDESVAKVDPVTGTVTGESYGTAVITARTGDGKTSEIEINVLGGKRRMLVAYYFGETGDSGYLPFAYNNGYSMTQTFSAATVEGQQYDIEGPYSNASRSKLFGAIDSHFADATDDDVSVLYICAHGSGSYGPTGEYAFSLNNTHHIMASELMSRLERIKGRVILIMDSCYSGGMIDCNKSRLDAQGGRISILTSSHRNTNSCYWNVSQKLTAVDFFTHALLQGVGFNESQGIGGDRGWFRNDGGPADDAGNGDDQVTVRELFDYAKKVTVDNVTKYKGRPEFHGNPAQTPQCYIGEMNEDLVLFSR